MISVYNLKPAFQNLLRPLSNWLAKQGVTANQVTVAAIIISLFAGLAVWLFPAERWPLFIVPVVLLVRMILNAIDGMLAREHHMKSDLGVFLNELGDVLSDIFIYFPFIFVPGIFALLIAGIVLLAVISEMTGVIATQIGAKRRYDGPMGKSDRAFFFGAISLLLGFGVEPGVWLDIVLSIMTVLLMITVINRIIHALREKSI